MHVCLCCDAASCPAGSLQCPTSSLCVPSAYFCDLDNDCGDNSDEPDTCRPYHQQLPLSFPLFLSLPRSMLMLVGVSKWLKPQAGNCENIRAACPRITSLTDGQLVHGPGITLLNSGLTCVRPLTLRNAEMSNRSNKHFKQCNVCSGRPARFTVAYVINNNRLRSTFSTIEANYWQTRSIARPLCDISTTCCQ